MENSQNIHPSGVPPVVPTPTTPEQRDRLHHKHHQFRLVMAAIITIVVAAIIFLAGMVVGRMQDRFSYQRMDDLGNGGYGQSQAYSGNGGMRSAFGTPGILGGSGMQHTEANANGAQGTISAINGNQVTVQGSNGVTTVVNITATTIIHSNGQDIMISALKTGDTVTVIGDPDSNGQIVARYMGVQFAQ